jgi:hypothetical protein
MNWDLPIVKHLRKIENQTKRQQIPEIDAIYIINLDKRPDRFAQCMNQFTRYAIQPYRVAGIHGWDLSQEEFNDVGVVIRQGMFFDRPVFFGPVARDAAAEYITNASVGKTCVHFTTPAGQVGCSLSHVSGLFDAYRSNYETFWQLEDDFTIQDPPALLGEYIAKLDALVGPMNWDVLYTDNRDHFSLPSVRDVMGGGNLGRPNIPLTNAIVECQKIGTDFLKIGGRTQAHSVIYRRSGIKKILDFMLNEGIFRPYDIDLPFVPNLKMYNLVRDIVRGGDQMDSDGYYKKP